jgi:hypothetical protein
MAKFERLFGRKIFLVTSLLAGLVGVSFLFQNCSQPASGGGSNSISSQAADIKFAYDSNIDQIAYMSCNNMGTGAIDNSTYFTLRAGAYRSAGIKLKDEFFEAMRKKPQDRLPEFLAASPENLGTNLQLAIRTNANYQQTVSNDARLVKGRDFDTLFAELGTEDMSDLLVSQWRRSNTSNVDMRMKYLRDGTVAGKRIEGQMAFVNGFNMANSIRTGLQNDGFLALTYTHSPDAGGGDSAAVQARSPADFDETPNSSLDARRTVFGTGYRFQFGQPSHYRALSMAANFPPIAIDSIREFNLEDPTQAGAQWICPREMEFRIIRLQDLTAALAPIVDCPMISDGMNTDQVGLRIVRNSFRVEDWWINMDKRCMIPKRERQANSNCYGVGTSGLTAGITVQYNLSAPCDFADTTKICTNFASVCYRP